MDTIKATRLRDMLGEFLDALDDLGDIDHKELDRKTIKLYNDIGVLRSAIERKL